MKRLVLTFAVALIFLNALVIPPMVHADGNPDGTNCTPSPVNPTCKP